MKQSTSEQLYEVYVIAHKRMQVIYDACAERGMTWSEIADDATYREAVVVSKKALDAWIKVRLNYLWCKAAVRQQRRAGFKAGR